MGDYKVSGERGWESRALAPSRWARGASPPPPRLPLHRPESPSGESGRGESGVPALAARVPADQDVRRDEAGNPFEESAIRLTVDLKLTDP